MKKENINKSNFNASFSSITDGEIYDMALKFHSSADIENALKYYGFLLDNEFQHQKFLVNYGTLFHQIGKHEDAIKLYNQSIRKFPKNIEAYSNLAIIYKGMGKFKEAELLLKDSIEIDPTFEASYFNLGLVFIDMNLFDKAELAMRNVIKLSPQNPSAYSMLGLVLTRLNKLNDAGHFINQAIKLKPDFHEAYFNLANLFLDLDRLNDSIFSIKKAIEINKKQPEYYNLLSSLLIKIGSVKQAEIAIRQAIRLNPKSAIYYCNLGIILQKKGVIEESEFSFRESIKINPNFSDALTNLGGLLISRDNLSEAEKHLRLSLSINNTSYIALSNLAMILNKKGNPSEAKLLALRAISICPDYIEAHNVLSTILYKLGQFRDAEETALRIIELSPNFSDAYTNLGVIYISLRENDKAINAFRSSIKINSLDPKPYSNLVSILEKIGRRGEAKSLNIKALNLFPENDNLMFSYIKLTNSICDWQSNLRPKILKKNFYNCLDPLTMMYLEDNPKNEFLRANQFHKNQNSSISNKLIIKRKNKIRLGYFSNNFCLHSVLILLIRVLELHDKNRFEIYIYDFGIHEHDQYTDRVIKIADCYRNVKELNNPELIELAKSDSIDIGIDMMGYTEKNRADIFSNRIAPIQVNYLDYPGTTGNKQIDYIIADKILIKKEEEKFYTEKVIRMPRTLQPTDDTLIPSGKIFKRSDLGINENCFVFSCFAVNRKIQPLEFNLWMNLLSEKQDSVIWFIYNNELAKNNLIFEASKRGIDSSRLIFSNYISLTDHMARQCCADLALDTFNFSSGTMTCLALKSGLPILTKPGKSFSSRLSASILQELDLNELIASDLHDYESKALNLSFDKHKLNKIKSKILSMRGNAPYFDSNTYRFDLECVFDKIYNFHLNKY